jgi:hypothetical protein
MESFVFKEKTELSHTGRYEAVTSFQAKNGTA